MKKIKRIVLGILVGIFITTISFYFYGFSRNDISHTELFKLKQDCSKLAQEFVEKRNESGLSVVNTLTWKVLHSDYNISRKSCFGEFDMVSYFPNTGKSFSEYRIYDLLNGNGRNIESLTHTNDSNPEEWLKYYTENSPKYFKLLREIFDLEKDEF